MTPLDILFWVGVLWVFNMTMRKLMSEGASQAPLERPVGSWELPIKLEYTTDQWFAWDEDDEFLGQAPTKQELINLVSERFDVPVDKFVIVSQQQMV